ncbi:hypothetical protein H6F43_17900 [Leptolyngbya sp. FACHB-36]|uniref:hypothetical protein n=1 Tax=Leptolyngbya sp. FACHB-36 TaxID=2692808 RepID=UPI001680099C|nr:hypothetical protein [Leptolyngbya sp. FACHB-36]MBD2022055.1 hypothetical protein [Leptolyngbya sp. FACHB-36]
MRNLNDSDSYNRDNYPATGDLSETGGRRPEAVTSQPVTPNRTAYRDGYVQGRSVEQHRTEVSQEIRDNDNAARGLIMGILLTGLVGLGVAATYFLTQRNEAPVNRTIVVPSAAPSPAQSPQVRDRIIERDRVVPVPVPQEPAPAPNVNITVPSPAPQAPASSAPTQTAPAQTAPTEGQSGTAPEGSAPAQESTPSSDAPAASPSGSGSAQ